MFSSVAHHVSSSKLCFRHILVVVKQTAYEEYHQLKLRGQAPTALRWERLKSTYQTHKETVNKLTGILRYHRVSFRCVNRVELDRQHLANVDLVVSVGGDGTVLTTAHFLDHGTIPLLGINADPISEADLIAKKHTDERRSHGALCMCTSQNMSKGVTSVLTGQATLRTRPRMQCIVKSRFSETQLVPVLNDVLIANPSPAAVSRFRMGMMIPVVVDEDSILKMKQNNRDDLLADLSSFAERSSLQYNRYGTVTRFGGIAYDIQNSFNVWSSGLWVCTATGSTGAMKAAGGQIMDADSSSIQYLIREPIVDEFYCKQRRKINHLINDSEQLHLRWNCEKGMIFIDGSHLVHNLDLGDEVLIHGKAPPLQLFM